MMAVGHARGWTVCVALLLLMILSSSFAADGRSASKGVTPPLWPNEVVERSVLVQRQSHTSVPAPVVVGPSQFWDGNDGPWSSFPIQVGNHEQIVRVLPSTASTSTWVVFGEGCPDDAPSDCPDSRGKIFNPNNSLTWVPNSIFELGVEENLITWPVNGAFGFDSLTLGWQGSGIPAVEHTVIAGIGDTAFSWLGALGLNPRPTNFSGGSFINNPQTSFLSALRHQNSIPSVSWSYTAGAPYRLNKVFGSLVLGGFDRARYHVPSTTSPNLTFPFYADVARDLLVGITSISTSNTTSSSSSTPLLKDGIYALIDSTLPHLWLPESVCEAFEKAFGLSWNSTSELYLIDSKKHQELTKLNPSITITLSPEAQGPAPENTVSIELPYSAFSLNSSWPHPPSYYFPLKRAVDDTQYTLGRAFLQEAYVIADYERSNFSVWPCSWDSNTNIENIVAIRSVNETSGEAKGEQAKKGLATGASAGIAVGIGLLIVVSLIVIFLYVRRRRRHRIESSLELQGGEGDLQGSPGAYPRKETETEELDSSHRHELPNQHVLGMLEASSDAERKVEVADTGVPAEADVVEVHEMEAGVSGLPHIFVEPPTAISPGPRAQLPLHILTHAEEGTDRVLGNYTVEQGQ
ncbi:acid protease [Polyplosphaeria fusca]|uniref:Acid protease n=1 Tax=Polyplosphaeria fusca TaxID=682080 RepID=A0A9P4QTQ8_9PLEO|nr:acid protease [Polyplosphaeria fusca]